MMIDRQNGVDRPVVGADEVTESLRTGCKVTGVTSDTVHVRKVAMQMVMKTDAIFGKGLKAEEADGTQISMRDFDLGLEIDLSRWKMSQIGIYGPVFILFDPPRFGDDEGRRKFAAVATAQPISSSNH